MSKFSPKSSHTYYSRDRKKLLKQGFPCFEACMQMMRKSDPQMQEDGFFSLAPHAARFMEELIAEFDRPENTSFQPWLIELIGLAKSPSAFSFLAEHLYSHDERLRYWAIRGLKELDTKEARTLQWKARSYQFESELESKCFQADLAEILDGVSRW